MFHNAPSALWGVLPSAKRPEGRAARGRPGNVWQTAKGEGDASTKSHASGKIKKRYFRNLRMGSDVFFDADSDAPHMT